MSLAEETPESTLILPTGDGMAIGFNDSPEKPLLLSIELHNNLQKYNSNKREKDCFYFYQFAFVISL